MKIIPIRATAKAGLYLAILLLSVLPIIGCTTADDGVVVEEQIESESVNMVDPNATEATKTLFSNLRKSASNGVIIGQQDAYLENDNKEFQSNCDIFDITGEYPLLTGGDLENLTNDDYGDGNWRYTRVENMAEWIKECYKRGIIVTLSWHFREPFYGDSFYTSDMDDATKESAFKSILEGGVNHSYYKQKLVLLADFFKSLLDDDGELIPVIFRPFHEFGGSWFWWGVPYYATSQEYIQNWQFMVDYLREDCMVHNLLYAFTPGFETEAEYLESYPGDDYVDILGFDTYTSNKIGDESERAVELSEMVSQLNIISTLADQRGKVAALTEVGHDIHDESKVVEDIYTAFYLEILNQIDGNIAYMMFWSNGDKRFTPLSDDTTYIDDFRGLVSSDPILTSDETLSPLSPNFY